MIWGLCLCLAVAIMIDDFYSYKSRKQDREDAKRWRELMRYDGSHNIKDEDIRIVSPRPKIEHKGKGLSDVN